MNQQNVLIVSKEAKTYSEDEVLEIFKSSNDLEEIRKVVENAESRLYTSWATVDAVDKEQQKVPIDEAIKQKEILMNRGAPIQDTHTNKNIGKTMAYRVLEHPVTKTIGILDLNKIYNDNVLDDKVWKETVDGKRQGSSVGGFSTDKQVETDSNSIFESLKGFNWLETSNVENPCNPFATNHAMSLIAKNDKMAEEKVQSEVIKQEEEVSTETPEVSVDDRVKALEEAVAAMMEKMNSLLEQTAGTPEVEKEESMEEETEKAEEEDKEDEVEKEAECKKEESEEEDSEVTKSLEAIKSELSEVKKQLEANKVVEVVKSEMPAVANKTEEKTHKFTDVMKGKVSLGEFTKN